MAYVRAEGAPIKKYRYGKKDVVTFANAEGRQVTVTTGRTWYGRREPINELVDRMNQQINFVHPEEQERVGAIQYAAQELRRHGRAENRETSSLSIGISLSSLVVDAYSIADWIPSDKAMSIVFPMVGFAWGLLVNGVIREDKVQKAAAAFDNRADFLRKYGFDILQTAPATSR